MQNKKILNQILEDFPELQEDIVSNANSNEHDNIVRKLTVEDLRVLRNLDSTEAKKVLIKLKSAIH